MLQRSVELLPPIFTKTIQCSLLVNPGMTLENTVFDRRDDDLATLSANFQMFCVIVER